MTEKYIDLAAAIRREYPIASGAMVAGIRTALSWLDEHPEAVPGRAITESRIAKAFGAEYVAWARMCLARIGITVVPDPEPTNAEKIAEEIDTYMQEHGFGDRPTADDLAAWLDQRGVKAPEGDEQ